MLVLIFPFMALAVIAAMTTTLVVVERKGKRA